MKRILSLFFAAVLLSSAAFAEDVPEMTFQKKTHNFGIVARDTCLVSYEFIFTNTGTAPLVIHQATSTCGCTVPEYTKEPVPPGQQGTIKVTYNGKTKRAGVFHKSITLFTNATTSPTYIYIEGEMIDEPNIEELVPATAPEKVEPADTITIQVQPAEKPRKHFLRIFRRHRKAENV